MKNSAQYNFKKAAAMKLRDDNLQKNLRKTLTLSNEKRRKKQEQYLDWQLMKDNAALIRQNVLDDLSANIDTFAANAEKNGMKVLWAVDEKQAQEYILDIFKENGAKSAVKSKSMLTEEIHLNSVLENAGISILETDLGEFIAQLANEPPSHITAPIIHLSKEDVGRIMEKYLGVPYSADPETLTKYARKFLRNHFLNAQIGISGVNFGLIKDGSIVIVENEGNARLCFSAPSVHIAVMGIERLLPSMSELPLFLKLLTISATGQPLTNYVSIINGSKTKSEADGPIEMYLILIDNGRSSVQQNIKYREILRCIRCGACMTVCPVYAHTGGHAYGSVYPGPLGAVLNPVMFSMEKYAQLPFASTLCGRCVDICPVKIPITDMLLELRADIVREGLLPKWEQTFFSAWAYSNKNPSLFNKTSQLLKFVQPLIRNQENLLSLPILPETVKLPELAPKSFHQMYRDRMKQ